MSRIGKKPIPIPKGVEITIDKQNVTVKGPKGSLTQNIMGNVSVKTENDNIILSIPENQKELKSFFGLYRSLINNMVIGVTQGFDKQLEMIGVGFRAALKGKILNIQVGFSNPIDMNVPENITVKIEKNTLITISGIDKQLVGEFAAEVRAKRPPEPYKGKGIRYKNEYVRKKAGKTGK